MAYACFETIRGNHRHRTSEESGEPREKLYPDLNLVQGDLEELLRHRADLIVCSEVVEHVGKAGLGLYFRSFYRVLEDGGWLLITTPRKEAYGEWSTYIQLDQPTEEWLLEDELRAHAEDAGFTVVDKKVYGSRPIPSAPLVDVYQQWLFRKPVSFSG